jgi:prepilin-type N-terminal cleavage/methylation domain-containing protein
MNQKGFTVLELLIVIAVIGILSSMVMSSMNNAKISARDAGRRLTVEEIQHALELYNVDNAAYPIVVTPSDLSVLSSYLVPKYISTIAYDTTNITSATYYRPNSRTDGYLIYVSTEKQLQSSPSAYGCRTGLGTIVDTSGLYPTAPLCH